MIPTRVSGWVGCVSLGLLWVLLGTSPVLAQDVTGSLQGSVLAEGRPQEQVRITLAGPQLQGTRQTLTDPRGFFQFLALPPGTYTLRAERIGLRPMDVREVVVELGRTTAVPLTLTVQAIEMEPVVTESGRTKIDPVHTAGGGTLGPEDYAALPVDVKTGGYEAQYGRALGAVVNAITYTGTNEFEMDLFGFATPGALAMDPKGTLAMKEEGAVTYDVGARVGGPIAKDRLWYSAAVNPRVDQVNKEIAGVGTYQDRTEALRFATKLTWQASDKTNLELSVFGDPTTRDQVDPLFYGMSTVTDPNTLLHRIESGGVVGSLRATVAPSRSFLLQGSVARQWDQYSDLPMPGSGEPGAAYVDWVDGSMGGGRATTLKEDRGRTSLTLRGTLLLPGHTLVAGVDYEDARVTSSLYGNQIQRFDTTSYRRDVQWYSGTFHNRSPAAYVQNSWRLTDRITLSPGLRWSGQYLIGASGRTAQSITDEWQPRIGFSWQLGEQNTHRLFGSYGRFYETIPTNIAVYWFVDYPLFLSYYSTDPREPGAIPDTVEDYTTYEKDWAKQIPGLQAENFDEFTLGYERTLGGDTKFAVRAVRRNLRSSFQWGLDGSSDTGFVFVLGTPGKGDFDYLPPPRREYTALEVTAEGAWRQVRYRTSYVLSRTWGNYPGLYNSDTGFEMPGQPLTFYTPWQAENSTGFLPNDRTHVCKLSGAWTSQFGLEAGAFVTFESGAPVNDFAASSLDPFVPVFLAPRGSAGRTPSLWNVDLRFGYSLPVVRGARTRIQLDLLHVGNPRKATWLDELHYSTPSENGNPGAVNPQYKQPRAYQPPMAARLGVQASF